MPYAKALIRALAVGHSCQVQAEPLNRAADPSHLKKTRAPAEAEALVDLAGLFVLLVRQQELREASCVDVAEERRARRQQVRL
jgi:hypothetical protein